MRATRRCDASELIERAAAVRSDPLAAWVRGRLRLQLAHWRHAAPWRRNDNGNELAPRAARSGRSLEAYLRARLMALAREPDVDGTRGSLVRTPQHASRRPAAAMPGGRPRVERRTCVRPVRAERKPGPVVGGHLSRAAVAGRLQRPHPGGRRAASCLPYWVLLRVGFAWQAGRPAPGGLLHHRCTLAVRRRRFVSVALSLGSPPLGVTQHPALRSPDFPRTRRARNRLFDSPAECSIAPRRSPRRLPSSVRRFAKRAPTVDRIVGRPVRCPILLARHMHDAVRAKRGEAA
jgi:hypothetical protein